MNSLLESQYNFPQSYSNGNQTHEDHSLHLSMTKPLKIPQLRGSEPLFKSEYDFIKEKKSTQCPCFFSTVQVQKNSIICLHFTVQGILK